MTSISGEIIFSDYDPYYALFHFWSGEVAISGFIVLGVVLLASLFIERPWCKYACPMNIPISSSKSVKNHQCISCMECTSENACPIKNTVTMEIKEDN